MGYIFSSTKIIANIDFKRKCTPIELITHKTDKK